MEETKTKKVTFKEFLNNLFGVNNIEPDLTEELKKSHLYDTINKLDEMAKVFNAPINEENKPGKNGGFSSGIKKDEENKEDTFKRMREIYDKQIDKQKEEEKDKERE